MKGALKALLFVFFLLIAQNSLAMNTATEQLKPTLDGVVAVLSDQSLKGDDDKLERRKKIMESVKAGFDFTEMSKRVLGRTWNTITDAEKVYFTELMTKLLENVYIGKLESYSGQQIVFSEERQKGDRAQVTTLIQHQGVELPIHYILKKNEDKWMVYDINIEGVSLIRNYKEQCRWILRRDRFDGLVKVLEDKNKSFEQEGFAGNKDVHLKFLGNSQVKYFSVICNNLLLIQKLH